MGLIRVILGCVELGLLGFGQNVREKKMGYGEVGSESLGLVGLFIISIFYYCCYFRKVGLNLFAS